jgi:acetylglutamate kinase
VSDTLDRAAAPRARRPPLVMKFGGELIEDPDRLETVVAAMADVHRDGTPLVIVHGGGREIDAALRIAGIPKVQVDGVRVTDEPTLAIVVAVLAGTVNTRFVAALNAAGVPAAGLTGADARCGLSRRAPAHRAVDGRLVDLGRVGLPAGEADAALPRALTDAGFVPVVASIGVDADGGLLNVNADTFAVHLAVRLGSPRLLIAGTTPGVLDERGATIPVLDGPAVERLISGGTATAGMIAKLRACEQALAGGVREVMIADGRSRQALASAAAGAVTPTATRVMSVAHAGG